MLGYRRYTRDVFVFKIFRFRTASATTRPGRRQRDGQGLVTEEIQGFIGRDGSLQATIAADKSEIILGTATVSARHVHVTILDEQRQ